MAKAQQPEPMKKSLDGCTGSDRVDAPAWHNIQIIMRLQLGCWAFDTSSDSDLRMACVHG